MLAVPTTYLGLGDDADLRPHRGRLKRTQRDARVLPKTVIYDPELTLGLPRATSAASGMNAIAHCVEAMYAQDANPIISLMAEEGIRALARRLPVSRAAIRRISRREAMRSTAPGSRASRSAPSAWPCTTSSATRWAAPGTCRTPRRTPSCCRTRRATTATRRPRRWRASRARSARRTRPTGLYDLEMKLGLRMKLADLGMKEADLERAAQLATQAPYPNPAAIEYAQVLELLQQRLRRPAPGVESRSWDVCSNKAAGCTRGCASARCCWLPVKAGAWVVWPSR